MKSVLEEVFDTYPHLCDLQLRYGYLNGNNEWEFSNSIPFSRCSTLVVMESGKYEVFNVLRFLLSDTAEEAIPLFAQCYTDLLLYNIWPKLFKHFELETTCKLIADNVPDNFRFIYVSTDEQIYEIIKRLQPEEDSVEDIFHAIRRDIEDKEKAIIIKAGGNTPGNFKERRAL
jgi:hypothetical protein